MEPLSTVLLYFTRRCVETLPVSRNFFAVCTLRWWLLFELKFTRVSDVKLGILLLSFPDGMGKRWTMETVAGTVMHSCGNKESYSSQSIERLGYGLDDRGVLGFNSRRGLGKFSLHHHVQNGSGAYPVSYPMGTRGSIHGGKAAGA
jgi:hypothetical protein